MTRTMINLNVEAMVEALRRFPDEIEREYHALTLMKGEGGRWTLGALSTTWRGWTDKERRGEIRVSTPVRASFAEAIAPTGISCLFISTVSDLLLFMRVGGAALVERSLAERFFPSIVEPSAAYLFGRSGFVDEGLLATGSLKRRPTAKQRKAVLARDGGRCRRCYRDPNDFIDMELEVHHIRPWSKGGTTDSTNLITLCRRCHKALKPHFDRGLFDLVEQRDSRTEIEQLVARGADFHGAIDNPFDIFGLP